MQPNTITSIAAAALLFYAALMMTTARWPAFVAGRRPGRRQLLTWIPLAILTGTVIKSASFPVGTLVALGALIIGGAVGFGVNRFLRLRGSA
jgi:predicted branched-subunit amino acid permease